MNTTTRSFYTRYYLLSMIAPAYVMALIFYGSAWLFSPASPLPRLLGGTVFYVGGVLVFIGISRLLGALGFWLSGVPRAQVEPSAADRVKLHQLLGKPPAAAAGDPASRQADTLAAGRALELQPVLVELGAVPFLSVGGFMPNQLRSIAKAAKHLLIMVTNLAEVVNKSAKKNDPLQPRQVVARVQTDSHQ